MKHKELRSKEIKEGTVKKLQQTLETEEWLILCSALHSW